MTDLAALAPAEIKTPRGFVWRRRHLHAWGVGVRWYSSDGSILMTQCRAGGWPAYDRWDEAAAESVRWAKMLDGDAQ